MKTRRPGFTLIELLIVIVVVGLLAAISVPFFWRAKDRGLEAAMQSDLKTLATFQEAYYERLYVYAEEPVALPGFMTSPGVEIEIGYAESDGWAAIARHNSLATRQCGIIVGEAPPEPGAPATNQGVVTCDDAMD
jgi:prepilin-type N-terminal cleavage/methylation domain-containing protein